MRTFTRSSERLAATIKPNSYDPKTRTATVVWSTGAKVRRETWDGPFDESLSLDPAHVRLEFLNSGKAPLLNAHRKGSATDQLGVIERAWIENGEGLALVRFSEREDVAPIARDVEAGIIKGVSVGYRIRKIKEMERVGGVPHLRAIDWEPKEISVVPLGADPDAGFRSEQDFHSCEVIRMDGEDQGQGTTTGASTGTKPGGDTTGKETPPQAGSPSSDRERMAEIVTLATRHGMGPEWAAEQIRKNATLDACRTAILGAMEARTGAANINGTKRATITRDAHETLCRGAELALLERVRPGTLEKREDLDLAAGFRGKRLVQVLGEFLRERGERVEGLYPSEIVERSFHTSTDFPIILANVARKTLRKAYETIPSNWRPLVRVTEVPDFKEVKRVQIGDAPRLVHKPEGAEVRYGSFSEAQEKFNIRTFARAISITREMVINDDLSALERLPSMWARACAELEADLVWEALLGDSLMSDGKPVFDKAHANVMTASALDLTSYFQARQALRLQKGLDDKLVSLNLSPSLLFVPPSLELAALKLFTPTSPAETDKVNPYAGAHRPIVEARLEDAKAWILAADPAQIDMVELAYLEGARGPRIETETKFENDVTRMKVAMDVGAKAIDWRGFQKINIKQAS